MASSDRSGRRYGGSFGGEQQVLLGLEVEEMDLDGLPDALLIGTELLNTVLERCLRENDS